MKLTVDLGEFAPCIEALGPGKRAGIWVRGCPFRCPGCCSPHFLEPGPPEARVNLAQLSDQIWQAHVKHGLEGISLSGGEPFAQAEALAEVLSQVSPLGLGIICYTGYRLETLRNPDKAPSGSQALLDRLDVLIDGPFRQDRPLAAMRGSDNQSVHLLTGRYSLEQLADSPQVDVREGPDGQVRCYGVTDERIRILMRGLGVELGECDS